MSQPRRRRAKRAALIFCVPLLLGAAVLTYHGCLYPLLPEQVTYAWVGAVTPIGISYDDARKRIARHGWRESSGSGPCRRGGDFSGAHVTVELGHIFWGVPVVTYTFAEYDFNSQCQLVSLRIVKEGDAL